jgi:hypothetical protein
LQSEDAFAPRKTGLARMRSSLQTTSQCWRNRMKIRSWLTTIHRIA